MNATVSARMGTLRAMAPEVEPMRKAKTAGTAERSMIGGMFVPAKLLPRICEAPDSTVTFLSSNAAKAAKVTSQSALFFRVFLSVSNLVFVMTKIVITPTSVEMVMSTFNASVKTTVTMIGKKEISSILRLAFLVASVFVFSGLMFLVFLNPIK